VVLKEDLLMMKDTIRGAGGKKYGRNDFHHLVSGRTLYCYENFQVGTALEAAAFH